MKKLLLILLWLVMIFSCGEKMKAQSAKDINVLEINDECELLDVYIIVVDEIIELADKYGKSNLNNLPIEEIGKFEMLNRKIEEIEAVNWKEGWNYKPDVYKDFGEHCENLNEFKKSQEYMFSFFVLNQGIERTTEKSLKSKIAETYAAFELNEIKAGPFKKQAYKVKGKADSLVAFIQGMKYNLVLAADGKVYLGLESENKDEDGKLIEEKGIKKEWKDLTVKQKTMSIAALSKKDDRHSSGDLFYIKKRKKNVATDLKEEMLVYKEFLILLANGNIALVNGINETYNLADKKQKKGASVTWEEYNFYDMPSVGALTLLSKMQYDVRNTEADVINMLMEKIDAKE